MVKNTEFLGSVTKNPYHFRHYDLISFALNVNGRQVPTEGLSLGMDTREDVSHGYRILEIHEVYEYQVTQYNPETGEGGLFANYINTFLKLKAEASGYPGWVRSPEDENCFGRAKA